MYYNQKVVLLIYERRTVSDERIVCTRYREEACPEETHGIFGL
jgi:hypothetical protein